MGQLFDKRFTSFIYFFVIKYSFKMENIKL